MSIESQLREALTARADRLPPADGADPWQRVRGAVRASRRRRRAGVAAGVVAAAALALALPSAVEGARDRTSPPATSVVPGPDSPLWQSIDTWPTRGNLAKDAGLIEGLEARTSGGHVLYAADGPGGRMAVVWGLDAPDGDRTLMALVGLTGAPAEELAVGSMQQGDPPPVVVVTRRSASGATAVVLTRPGPTTADLSQQVTVDPDTTVRREWAPMALRDGLGEVPLSPATFRLVRVQVEKWEGPARLEVDDVPRTVVGFCVACAGAEFRDTTAAAVDDQVADDLGLDVGTLQTSVVHAGAADATHDFFGPARSARVHVADTTLRGGAVLRTVTVQTSDGSGGGGISHPVMHVPIDAASAPVRPTVLFGTVGGTASAQVFAPRAATVQLVPREGAGAASPTVPVLAGRAGLDVRLGADGVIEDYDVVARDAAGREQGRWPASLPNASDPFGLGL